MTTLELEQAWVGLENALRKDNGFQRERCGYSELFPDECAHCLGHRPEGEPDHFVASKVIYG